jgi:hypothetical protein
MHTEFVFAVFDTQEQQYQEGRYPTAKEAQNVADKLNAEYRRRRYIVYLAHCRSFAA